MGRIDEALRKTKAGYGHDIARSKTTGTQQRLKPAGSVYNGTNRPDVSTIPESHVVRADVALLREQRVIATSEHDERVGPYRQLRTQILKKMRDNQWSTLAITSAHRGAGKSLTAVNLAISLARDVETKVLLVDLDLNTPSVHEKLNLNPEKGIIDFLNDQAEFESIVFDIGIDRLTVLAGRSAGKESSELLASPKLHQLLRDLYEQDVTDITIFDLPPLLRNDDAILFAPYADATLVVVEDGVTTEEDLRRTMQLLKGVNVIGTVLNKVKD